MFRTEDRFSPQGVEFAPVGSVVDLVNNLVEVLDGRVRVLMVEVIKPEREAMLIMPLSLPGTFFRLTG